VKPASHDLAPNAHLFGSDTDQAIERMVVSAWRSMSPHVRLTRALSATATVNALTRAGARQRGRTPSEQWRAYAEVRLGAALTDASYGGTDSGSMEDSGTMDHLGVLLLVIDALTRCALDYVVGGSLASSASGEPRATIDVDLTSSPVIGARRRCPSPPISSCTRNPSGDVRARGHLGSPRRSHARCAGCGPTPPVTRPTVAPDGDVTRRPQRSLPVRQRTQIQEVLFAA
jgi:hypothetical protein